MVADAESHAEEDRKFRELVEARNKADALVHSTEKALKDLGEKVQPADRAKVEAAISDLKQVVSGDDISAINAKTTALAEASAAIAQQAYAQGAEQGQAEAGATASGPTSDKDDVLDAEFEEIKDRKKGT